MSEQRSQSDGTHQPGPPPFNPLASHHGMSSSPTMGHSVVSDLMRVYESLTQSSTPQDPPPQDHPPPPSPGPGPPHEYQAPAYAQHASDSFQHQHQQPHHQQQTTQYEYIHQEQQYPPSFPQAPMRDQPSPYPFQDQEPDPAPSRPQRKRSSDKGSDSSTTSRKSRKKGSESDGRWSKRFTWPETLHKDFVSAIFDVGLKHASPTSILEHMPEHEQITTERIKSHLQKYRLHREKSKAEFMTSYEASLGKLQDQGVESVKSLGGGEVAAHATYSDQVDAQDPGPKPAAHPPHEGSGNPKTDVLTLPQLTEAEKASPLGTSLGYLLGLFFSLKQQLLAQRAMEGRNQNPIAEHGVPVAVYNDFVKGPPHMDSNALAPPHAANIAVKWHGPPPQVESPPVAVAHGSPMTAIAKAQSQVIAASATRNNLEENNKMKREMQNQMAFQNKMRALKQQELNKYKKAPGDAKTAEDGRPKDNSPDRQEGREEESKGSGANRNQGAGETAGDSAQGGNRPRGNRLTSLGSSEDFWNSDVVDDQLFEFLMNN